MKQIILHGGYGTRLKPLTDILPKGFIPILNKSTVSRIVGSMQVGCPDCEIFIVIPKNDSKIPYLIAQNNLPVQVLPAAEYPMKTVVELLKRFDEHLLIWWGDTLMNLNVAEMIKVHQTRNSKATIALWETSLLRELKHWGSVTLDNSGHTLAHPVPDISQSGKIKAGAFIFSPALIKTIESIADSKWNMSNIINTLLVQGIFIGYSFTGYRININYGSDLLKAMRFLVDYGGNDKVSIGKEVDTQSRVEFEGYVSIGNSVQIAKGVHISNSIILDNSIINQNATIIDSIIGPNAIIERDSFIRRKMIVDYLNTTLSENNY